MIRRRYRRDGLAYRHIRPRHRRGCWRGAWANDRERAHALNGPHEGHISSIRGGWLYQFFRYCGDDVEAHDPLKWADSRWLSPQRHNGMPILVGAMESERDHSLFGVEEWE